MAAVEDINHPPPGGFKNGGWYWDPQAKQARQFWNGSFGAPNVGNNPNQTDIYGKQVGSGGGGAPAASGPSNPLESVNKIIQDSFQSLQNEVQKRWGDYTTGNPFKVDQVLADKRNEAKEQIDPYYDQILGDYLLGVTTKINRGVDDTKDLLTELSASTDSYTEKSQNSLSTAVEQAQQGFADSGLTGSGDALRAEGAMKQSVGSDMTDYLRKTGIQRNQLITGNQRNIQDINADKTNFVTNLEQNRSTDTQTRAGQLTKEAGQQYIQGFQSVLPTQLQSASGFDMLKSLGIYS